MEYIEEFKNLKSGFVEVVRNDEGDWYSFNSFEELTELLKEHLKDFKKLFDKKGLPFSNFEVNVLQTDFKNTDVEELEVYDTFGIFQAIEKSINILDKNILELLGLNGLFDNFL